MAKQEPEPYQLWQPFNFIYGPWYRADIKTGDQTATIVLQPDMDGSRWFWSIRFPASIKKGLVEYKQGGTAPDLEAAKEEGLAAARTGRPK